MSHPHPNPELSRFFRQNDPAPLAGGAAAPGRASRAGWVSSAPATRVKHGYFWALPFDKDLVDGENSGWGGVWDGRVGWYPLASVTPREFGDDFSLLSLVAEMMPPDSDVSAIPDPDHGLSPVIPWGDVNAGAGAVVTALGGAIVVGRNLPIDRNGYAAGVTSGWTLAPCDCPGVFGTTSPGTTTRVLRSVDAADPGSNNRAEYLALLTFPGGNLRAAVPIKVDRHRTFSGSAARFANDDRLDVAFVCDACNIFNNIGVGVGYIRGHALVSLTLAGATPTTTLSR